MFHTTFQLMIMHHNAKISYKRLHHNAKIGYKRLHHNAKIGYKRLHHNDKIGYKRLHHNAKIGYKRLCGSEARRYLLDKVQTHGNTNTWQFQYSTPPTLLPGGIKTIIHR